MRWTSTRAIKETFVRADGLPLPVPGGLMEYRPLGTQRLRRVDAVPRHDDVRLGDRRGRRPRAARRLHRRRRDAGRHRRRLQRRRQRGDRRLAGWRKAPGEVRDQIVLATKGRFPMGDGPNDVGLSRRHLDVALDRVAAPARRRHHRPLPGTRLRPAHAAGGDPALPRRRGARRQDPLRRAEQLHRLAGAEGGRRGRVRRAQRPGHPAAAVQPARPRDRVGDGAGVRGERPRTAARGRRSAGAG